MKAIISTFAATLFCITFALNGAAQAATFELTYTDGGTTFGDLLLMTGDSSSPYLITGVSGTETLLGVPDTVTGLDPGHFGGADNKLFIPPPYFDVNGLSFITSGGDSINLYFSAQQYLLLDQHTDANYLLTSVAVAAVPEASTWAMMTLGFCGLGFLAYCRKSKPVFMAA